MTVNGREPHFDLDAAFGRTGELWTRDIRTALERGLVEVKTDRLALKTSKLYVEYECFRQGKWQPSGINDTRSEAWLFKLDPQPIGIIIATDHLRILFDELLNKKDRRDHYEYRREETHGSHPTRGVVIPLIRVIFRGSLSEAHP
jgi:hypothetical protein